MQFYTLTEKIQIQPERYLKYRFHIKQWFLRRIGKKVYNDYGCSFVIKTHKHALTLFNKQLDKKIFYRDYA